MRPADPKETVKLIEFLTSFPARRSASAEAADEARRAEEARMSARERIALAVKLGQLCASLAEARTKAP